MLKIIFFFLSFSSNATEISFSESVTIEKPIYEVFDFVADARNDEYWRTEVHSISSEGPFEIGTIYTEDAFLGLHYNYITKVKLEELDPPFSAVYVTTIDNPFRLESHREFFGEGESSTRFKYTVYVEKDLIYDILFPGVPIILAEFGYKSLMKSYLKKLKKHLEAKLY